MLEQQISKDYITAMKAKDKDKSATLNFLRAKIKDVKIEKRVDQVEDTDVIVVIKKQVKQLQDSITQFKEAGRDDLVEKEQIQLDIIKVYLPEDLPAEKVQEFVKEAIAETGASSMKDMGSVMKAVMVKTAGNADNAMVSQLVKKELSEI